MANPVMRRNGLVLRVGFYGCGAIDRVVRVAWRGSHYLAAPNRATVECPCGFHHAAEISWRSPVDEDEWSTSDLMMETVHDD